VQGDKYIGQWQNDESDGQGMYIYPDGKIEMGVFKKDKLLK